MASIKSYDYYLLKKLCPREKNQKKINPGEPSPVLLQSVLSYRLANKNLDGTYYVNVVRFTISKSSNVVRFTISKSPHRQKLERSTL